VVTSDRGYVAAGYCYDAENGMYYLSARHYDPGTRQFLSKDLSRNDGEESAYQYCAGNPVKNVDPNGLFWGWLKKAANKVGSAFKKAGQAIGSAVVTAGRAVGRAAVTAGRAVYKYGGKALRYAGYYGLKYGGMGASMLMKATAVGYLAGGALSFATSSLADKLGKPGTKLWSGTWNIKENLVIAACGVAGGATTRLLSKVIAPTSRAWRAAISNPIVRTQTYRLVQYGTAEVLGASFYAAGPMVR
jgi:RHS repeat-associated protein